GERVLETALPRLYIRRVEKKVAQPVGSGLEAPGLAIAVGHPPELGSVADEKVEAAIGSGFPSDFADVLRGRLPICEKTTDQGTPGLRRTRLRSTAIVRHRGEPAAARDAHPGAARLEVAPGQDRGLVRPERRRRGRAGVELVAVRGGDEPRLPRALPGEQDEAHQLALTKRSSLRWTPSLAPSRSISASNTAASFTSS